MNDVKDLVIIGAGLSGLALAYYLRDAGLSIQILEARDRLGGRIETIFEAEHQPIEMGATWLGSKHQALRGLLKELCIDTFEQHIGDIAVYEAISTSPPILAQLPPNPDPSMRIKGGTIALIDALFDKMPRSTVSLNQTVLSITKDGETMTVHTSSGQIQCKKVVSTLPPHLFVRKIKVEPSLPKALIDVASATQTWMGESIKVGLSFESPFWHEPNTSGTIFSNVGPVPEMYDHGNPESDYAALMGFLNGAYYNITRQERLEKIKAQLQKYYGHKAYKVKHYYERVWCLEEYTHIDYDDHVLPHQNNGHAIYRKPYLDDKLFIGGTETATIHPGYMDGAIVSAQQIARQLLKS